MNREIAVIIGGLMLILLIQQSWHISSLEIRVNNFDKRITDTEHRTADIRSEINKSIGLLKVSADNLIQAAWNMRGFEPSTPMDKGGTHAHGKTNQNKSMASP